MSLCTLRSSASQRIATVACESGGRGVATGFRSLGAHLLLGYATSTRRRERRRLCPTECGMRSDPHGSTPILVLRDVPPAAAMDSRACSHRTNLRCGIAATFPSRVESFESTSRLQLPRLGTQIKRRSLAYAPVCAGKLGWTCSR